MAIEGIPQGYDPVFDHGIYEVQIYSQVYETLLRLDSDYHTILPNLVKSWTVNADSHTYRFRLQPGVRFQNGRCLTVEDVLYTLDRYRTEVDNWLLKSRIEHFAVIDSLTFELRLRDAFAPFLYALCSPYIFVVQSQPLTEEDKGRNGTGPYFIHHLTYENKLYLQRNKEYWQGQSQIREICFTYFPNYDDAVYALEHKEVDILYLISGFNVDRLKWTGKVNYTVNRPVNTIFIGFNNQQPPFNDPRMRKAILHALHLPKIVYYPNRGNAVPATGPLPPIYDDIDAPVQPPQDIELASKLMIEARMRGKIDIRFFLPSGEGVRQYFVELVKVQLRTLGIILQVEIFNGWQVYTTAIMSERSQMFLDGYDSEIIGDPWNFLWVLFHSKSPQNTLNYHNEQVDSLLNLAEIEYDSAARNKIYKQIETIIINETPAVFLEHIIPNFAFGAEKIKHLSVTPYQILNFCATELYQ